MGEVGAVVGHGVVHAQARVALKDVASVDFMATEGNEAAPPSHWAVVAKEIYVATQHVGREVVLDEA